MTNGHFSCENLRNCQWPFYLWKSQTLQFNVLGIINTGIWYFGKIPSSHHLSILSEGLSKLQIYDILWCLVIWHWANELLFQNSWIPCGQSIESLYLTDPTWLCLISSCVSKFPFSKYALTDLTLLMGIGFLVTCCRQILSRGPLICDTIFMFPYGGTPSTN